MIKKLEKSNLKKIQGEILDLKKALLNLNFQKSTGQLEKTSNIRKTKKDIAKLKMQVSKINGEQNA